MIDKSSLGLAIAVKLISSLDAISILHQAWELTVDEANQLSRASESVPRTREAVE